MEGSVGIRIWLCLVVILSFYSVDAADKTASKSTQTDPSKRLINWEKLEVVDFLRSGALLVAFLFVIVSDIRGGRRSASLWTRADAIGTLAAGLACYFFPVSLLQYQTTAAVGPWHTVFCQGLGTVLIGLGVSSFHLRKSLDTNALVYSSWILARVLGILVVLLVVVHAHLRQGRMTDQHMTFTVFGLVLWFAGSAYNMFTTCCQSLSTQTRVSGSSPINTHLLIDLLFCLCLGIGLLAFPEWVTEANLGFNGDSLHNHLHRLAGGLILIQGLQALVALYYDDDEDKKSLFLGRVVGICYSIPMLLLHQMKDAPWSWGVFAVSFGLDGLLMGNALMAYMTDTRRKRL